MDDDVAGQQRRQALVVQSQPVARAVAARYAAQTKGTPKDLLYKIYVKYLPLRKVS